MSVGVIGLNVCVCVCVVCKCVGVRGCWGVGDDTCRPQEELIYRDFLCVYFLLLKWFCL